MSLLMLLIAEAYAALGARGALVEGWPLRPSFRIDDAEPHSPLRAGTTRGLAARTARASARSARNFLAA